MTGDELIADVTRAQTLSAAMHLARTAPVRALREAADLLYIPDPEFHGKPWLAVAVVREARA